MTKKIKSDFDTSRTSELRQVRDEGTAFAKLHVQQLAVELLEWQNTSILRSDGRVRELAHLLKALDTAHALKIAENFAIRAALEFVATSPELP